MAITNATATKRVRDASGLVDPNVITTAAETKSPGKLVPFITAEATVWKVDFDNIKFAVREDGREKINQYIKRMTCYLSPTTGQVTRIESEWPDRVPGTRFPNITSQEQQMERVAQTFTGLPSVPPTISLMEAIQLADPATIANAKQIIAYYVMEAYSEPKIDPRAVWVIHAWGIPPLPPIGGSEDDVPEDARNHRRFIVNVETGESYGSDTIPQPD